MGLFGSIGKVFGGALKVAGKVAGVASAIAPIPGLGFAGKVASGLGGIVGKASRTRERLQLIQTAASGGAMKPGVMAGMSPVMPGGAVLTGPGGIKIPGYGAPKKRRKRRKVFAGRRRTSKRGKRRGRWTAAQLRAGFGGRRRMRGR